MLRMFSKIRLLCPRCGEASPRWRCTGCTLVNDDLYPTRFGIWAATCMKCNQSLPTTVVGQRNIDKICGVCGYDLSHPDLGCLPEFHIAVVGAKNGGKSHLMTVPLNSLTSIFVPKMVNALTFASFPFSCGSGPSDPQFAHPIQVPAGFPGYFLSVPRPPPMASSM